MRAPRGLRLRRAEPAAEKTADEAEPAPVEETPSPETLEAPAEPSPPAVTVEPPAATADAAPVDSEAERAEKVESPPKTDTGGAQRAPAKKAPRRSPRKRTPNSPTPSLLPPPTVKERVKVSGHVSAQTKEAIDALARANLTAWEDRLTTVNEIIEAALFWFFEEEDGNRQVLSRSCMGSKPFDKHVPVRIHPELAEHVKSFPPRRKGYFLDAIVGTYILQVVQKSQ